MAELCNKLNLTLNSKKKIHFHHIRIAMYGMYGMYNSPPGLEHLTQVDQLLVHQLVEPYEG